MTNKAIKIGNKTIGAKNSPFIIAEAGSNHNQSLDTALRLIDVAAEAKADAVKFQLFQAAELYPPGTDMYKIFKSVELNADWLQKLSEHARDRGLIFMASAFDKKSIDFLEDVNVLAHKIASSETTNIPLLGHFARTGKPLLISTGMCNLMDVIEAVTVCKNSGNDSIGLFQCGAMYPLPPELSHLRTMDLLFDVFGYPVGFSDHTLDIHISLAAVARGATMIEKHYTLDRSSKGPDHFYALEPKELADLVKKSREIHLALGDREKEMLPEERTYGRREGIYVKGKIKKGDFIQEGNLEVKRPALGIRARFQSAVVGAMAKVEIGDGSALNWSDIDIGAK